jgi:molybdate transport system substrate-binding protein
VRRLAVGLAAVCLLAGCSGGTTDAAGSDDGGTLTVLAAASLTESFTELADIYEKEHPGVDVRLAFDSSATLAGQVREGAPADVLATADAPTMREVSDAGVAVGEPSLFATNTMVLVVPAANPARISAFADLEGTTYVTCATSAPCGALAESLLDLNHVATEPRSLEVDVKAVLNKVVLDEADAGLVYATDAVAAGDKVEVVEIPNSSEAVNSYLVAVMEQSEDRRLARDWVDLVLSGEGRSVLERAGFGPP